MSFEDEFYLVFNTRPAKELFPFVESSIRAAKIQALESIRPEDLADEENLKRLESSGYFVTLALEHSKIELSKEIDAAIQKLKDGK